MPEIINTLLGLWGRALYLITDFFLVFSGKVDEVVVLCANQEWNCSLVKATALPVPFLDAVECRLSCKVKHEEDSNCVVAD